MAVGGVFSANGAFLVAGLAVVVGGVLVETVRTDRHAGRVVSEQEGFEGSALGAGLAVSGVDVAR